MALAGLTKQDAEEKKGPRKSEGDGGESIASSRTGSESSDDDDSALYRSEESEGDNDDDAANKAAARRRKEQATQYFKIETFPEESEAGNLSSLNWPP